MKIIKFLLKLLIIFVGITVFMMLSGLFWKTKLYFSKEGASCGQVAEGTTCAFYRCDTGYARVQISPGSDKVSCSDQSRPRLVKETTEYN